MKVLYALMLCAALAACTPAPSQQSGALRISEAWSKATPPNAPVAGGYLSIDNQGDSDDRLLRVESTAARRVEIHEMREQNGVVRMRQLEAGLQLPARATTRLEPGGLHLMFIGPVKPFVEGEQIAATLVFEKAGASPVVFHVKPLLAATREDYR